jgi:hypothetical protein
MVGCLDAVHTGHANIQQTQIRAQYFADSYGSAPSCDISNHLMLPIRFNHPAQPIPG